MFNIELILSAPTTSTFLCAPVSTNRAPVDRAKRNALQAAERSNPQAFFAPIFSWITQAVDGKSISGVTVATMMQSISSAEMPRRSRHCRIAGTARSLVAPSFRNRLSTIPVLSRIH